MSTQTAELLDRWIELQTKSPGIRIRDAAEVLSCSEERLLLLRSATAGDRAAQVGVAPDAAAPQGGREPEVRRLNADAAAIYRRLHELGRVMALTRNDAVVSEVTGTYGDLHGTGASGLVHTDDIDLRIRLDRHAAAYAVTLHRPSGPLHGLQFFDAAGDAVHKVYLTDGSDGAAYARLVEDMTDPVGEVGPEAEALHGAPGGLHGVNGAPGDAGGSGRDRDAGGSGPADDAGAPRRERLPVDALREEWGALQNVHHFAGMLRRLGYSRREALSAVGGEFARRIETQVVRSLLEQVRDAALPIMVFVRSPAVTQIFSGTIGRLQSVGEYFNVFDEGFHLHIREPRLQEAWLVRKPTADGIVTSVEIYAADDEPALQVFGVRHDGEAENPAWRELAEGPA